MKKLLLALTLALAPSLAFGQCSGVFADQTVCGNATGASNTPRPTAITGFTGLFANPTASVGLSVVNGTATTAMRSDGAPPLSSSVQSALSGTNAYLLQGTGSFGYSAEQYCTLTQGCLGGSQAAATANQIPVYPGTGGAAVPTSATTWFDAICSTTVGQFWVRETGGWGCTYLGLANPVWWGADATGVADSTTAINSALAIGVPVQLPCGTFKITAAITIPTNDTLGGSGSCTFIANNSTTITSFNLTNSNWVIKNFDLVPSATRTNGAVDFNITASGLMSNVNVHNGGIPYSLNAGSGTVVILDNANTLATVLNGVDLQITNCFLCTIQNSIYSGNSAARAFSHVNLTNVNGQVQFLNDGMFQASQGIYVNPGSGQVVTLVKIDNTYIDSNPNGALFMTPSVNGIIQRFSITNSWLAGTATSPEIRLTGGGATTIDEVSIRNSDLIGTNTTVDAIDATGLTYLELAKNRIQHYGGVGAIGIKLDGVLHCDLDANFFVANVTVGISMVNATDYCSLRHNDLVNATTKLTNTSSGTHNIIHDNPGWNPVGVTAPATLGASPVTVTAGPSPETHYLAQSATNTATCTQGGQQVAALKAADTFYQINLGPNESFVCTWVTTAPTDTKFVH